MPATNAISSFGTQFLRGDGATPTEAFTAIAEVKDIDGPSMSREAHDASTHGSPGGYAEFVGGLRDGGDISFTLNLDPADTGFQDLRNDYEDNAPHNYQIIFPDAGAETVTFPGLVTDFSFSAPVDGILELEVTIKVAGQPTWT